MEFKTIILDKKQGIAKITLNRPDSLNALNRRMMTELKAALDDVNGDDEVRVLVLTGAGRSFCAGGDLSFDEVNRITKERGRISARDLPNLVQDDVYVDVKKGRLTDSRWQLLLELAIYDMPKPTIAMVNGPAFGGGFDMTLSCDLRIGSEKTVMGTGYSRMGLIGATGGKWLLPRIIGVSRALEVLYTGDSYSGEEAFQIGLLNRFVPDNDLENETITLARSLAKKPPLILRLLKSQVHEGLNSSYDASRAFASACSFIAFNSEDFVEGMTAFAQKRTPEFKFK